MQEKIKIVVISEEEDIKSLQITIENLNNNSCNSNDYVIAVNINNKNVATLELRDQIRKDAKNIS